MIGYAPFLGQVQLVPYAGFRLGQEDFTARLEVRNAETGAYIKGARIYALFPGGSVAKDTDIGGNASFSRSDFIGTMPPETPKGSVRLRVEAQGYEPKEMAFVGGTLTTVDLQPVKASVPGAAPPSPSIPTWGYVAGGAVTVGLIALLAS